MHPKFFFYSKTLWLNGASLSLVFLDWATGKHYIDPTTQLVFTGLVNWALRWMTDEPISLTPPPTPLPPSATRVS